MPRGANPYDLVAELERRAPPHSFDVPALYSEFVRWMRVKPTVAQLVVCKVSFDGTDPQDLRGAERDIARTLYGDVDTIPEIARRVAVAVCGRRGGKSYLFEALPSVHAMFTVPLFMVAPGQLPIALVISPNDGLRQEVTNYALGAIRSHPELKRCLVVPRGREDSPILKTFMIRRPVTGELVGFQGGVATKGGYGGRGRSLVFVSLDEAAFFRGAENVVNDEQIFSACIPGLLPDAKLSIGTTPWAQAGLVWRLFEENHGHPKAAVVAHAPTQVLRPELSAEVEAERTRDPDACELERDAKFMGFGTTQFFSDALIDLFFSKDAAYGFKPTAGHTVYAGVDLGLRSDSSALATGSVAPGERRLIVAQLKEKRPKPGQPLVPSKVCTEFSEDAASVGAKFVLADQHYLESLRENAVTLRVAPVTVPPGDVYIACRQMIREGKFVMAHPDTLTGEDRTMALRLKAQMREVQGTPVPGGGMSIRLPRWRTGGHCDVLSAVVLLGYQRAGLKLPEKPPEEGTPEHEAALKEQRRKDHAKKTRRFV